MQFQVYQWACHVSFLGDLNKIRFPIRYLQCLRCFICDNRCNSTSCLYNTLEVHDSENNCHVKSSWASTCSFSFDAWQLPRWQASCHNAGSKMKLRVRWSMETNLNTCLHFPSGDIALKVWKSCSLYGNWFFKRLKHYYHSKPGNIKNCVIYQHRQVCVALQY